MKMRPIALCSLLISLFVSAAAAAPLRETLQPPVQLGHNPEMTDVKYVVDGMLHVKFTRDAKRTLDMHRMKAVDAVSIGIESLDRIHREAGVTAVKGRPFQVKNVALDEELGISRWYVVEFPASGDGEVLLEKLRNDPNVETVDRVYRVQFDAVPNDPLAPNNWGHNNTGQLPDYCWSCGGHPAGSPVGTVGFDARAHAAWDSPQGYGSAAVTLAIIDDGVWVAHPDLNVVDGYDFVSGDTDPTPSAGDAHGTNCAGVAAGIANNGIGVAGVAGGVGLMGLRIQNSVHVSDALIYAADNGADVASMSFSFPGLKTLANVDAACTYAWNAGVLMLSSTGNDNEGNLWVPAVHPDVMGVGAASPCGSRKRSSSNPAELNSGVFPDPNSYSCDGERWWGSNWGSNTQDAADAVEVIAPTILPGTDNVGAAGYEPGDYNLWFNGTSCASPYAAGVAALTKSVYPSFTNVQLRARLRATATDINDVETVAGWDQKTGYGMVNAGAANLPDFQPFKTAGMDDFIVASDVSGLTLGSAPFSAQLSGDATNYFYAAGHNASIGVPTANTSWITQLSGVNLLAFGAPVTLPGTFYHSGEQARFVPAGRHALVSFNDFLDTEAEIDESNNNYGIQVVATPVSQPGNTMVTRAAPRDFLVGGSEVVASGNPFDFNTDGVGIASDTGIGYWNLAGIHPQNNAEGLFVGLFNPTTGIFAGQDNASWTGIQSLNSPGMVNAVLVNYNLAGTPFELGVGNQSGAIGDYFVEHRIAPFSALEAGSNEVVPMVVDQMLEMRELWAGIGGLHRVTFEVVGSTQPVTLGFFDNTFTQGSLADAVATVTSSGGAVNTAFVDLNLVASDYNGLAFYRHPMDGNAPLEIHIKVRQAVDVVVSGSVPQPVSLFSVPNGAGDAVTNAWTWDGVVGNSATRIDATVGVEVRDTAGSPLPFYPAEEIRLVSSFGGLKPCFDGNVADAPTDISGTTKFTLPLAAGGHSNPGEVAQVLVSDVPSQTTAYAPAAGPGLDIRFNSADITGDGRVDLIDIGEFSIDFAGAYNYRSDFRWDGVLNLQDIGEFAAANGAVCAAPPIPAPAKEGEGEILVAFDMQDLRDAASLAPGELGTAYVLLRNAGEVIAWQAAIESSDNLVVRNVSLPHGSLNLGEGMEFRVGLGQARAKAAGPTLLATVHFEVTDTEPAWLQVHGLDIEGATPAVALAAGAEQRLVGVDVRGDATAAAFVNGGSASATDTPIVVGAAGIRNLPNPFNPSTEIWFELPRRGTAEVRVYDVAGRLVRTLGGETLGEGTHSVQWNGTDRRGTGVVSGVYYYELRLDGARVGKPGRMNLVK